MKKVTISPQLQEYARKHNQVINVDKNGNLKFEDALPPVDWSAIIAYSVIVLGLVFAVFCLIFKW